MNIENHPIDETSQVDFTEQSSVTSTCDLVGGPVGSSTLQPPAAEGFTPLCSINPTKSNDSIISFKNKKRNNIKMAALYDNMISATYTLHNGELDKEKIENQKVSFVAIKS